MQINRDPSPRQLRQFGGLTFVFALLLSVVLWRRGEVVWALTAGGGGAIAAAVSWFFPLKLRAIFILLCYAAYPAGFAVGVFSLALAYYGVLTPIGLALRGIGALRGYGALRAYGFGESVAAHRQGGATAEGKGPSAVPETFAVSETFETPNPLPDGEPTYWRRRSAPTDASRYFQQF